MMEVLRTRNPLISGGKVAQSKLVGSHFSRTGLRSLFRSGIGLSLPTCIFCTRLSPMAPQKDTSPSPCEKCISPMDKLAPSTKTGKYILHPCRQGSRKTVRNSQGTVTAVTAENSQEHNNSQEQKNSQEQSYCQCQLENCGQK